MSQKQDPSFQKVRTRTSSPLVRVFSKRITWFSITACLFLLLAAALMLLQQNPTGAYAAQGKHGTSVPTHVPAKPRSSHPPRTAPVMSVSSLTLNFNISLAQSHMFTQTFTAKNSGLRTLYCHSSTTTTLATWAAFSIPSKGTIAAGQTVPVTVNVNPTPLTPGVYTTHLVLLGVDQHGDVATGSPQTITITLTVTP